MPATAEQLLIILTELGISHVTHSHAPVFTVEEARAETGHLEGGHSKNLFLKDKKGSLWLMVCKEDTLVDLKKLRPILGAKNLSFGKPELLMEVLGVTPGSVSPFALINDRDNRVRVVLDQRLMQESQLNFHPLENDKTTQISPKDLICFIEHCGHVPQIMSLVADPADEQT